MIDWLLRHRPDWLGRLAMWWVWQDRVTMPASWVPHVLSIGLGRRGHRVKDEP